MSEEPVVSRVKPVESQVNHAAQLYQAYQNYLNQNRSKTTEAKGKGNANMQQNNQSSQDSEMAKKVSKLAPGLGKETALRFEVNSDTQDVIVRVIDRQTNKVISTIPVEAIKDIPVGELMQFSI